MTGVTENRVTYPEFYRLKNGDLIFMFRDGSSGNGNLVMNHYDTKNKKWTRRQNNLVDGEGERNAYWQMCIDHEETIHVSWVWRESGDVATNHDLCYAKSYDFGQTWQTSQGRRYELPIQKANAEYVAHIPQKSNLINHTSMTTDYNGNSLIATYFQGKGDSSTQFKVVYQHDGRWLTSTVSDRTTNFNLGGGGTRSIPISRPQIVVQNKNHQNLMHVVYREEEYQNKICLATAEISEQPTWHIQPIHDQSMGRWEPSYDIGLWEKEQILHLYHQEVYQGRW